MELTSEQNEVIEELITEAIKRQNHAGGASIWTANEFWSRMLYNHKHGTDAAKKLVVDYILYLRSNDPTNPKIELLQTVIPESRFHTWLLESEYEKLHGELPLDKISFDGHGYVYLSNGFRVDSEDDLYREERLRFNDKKGKYN
jgi:hypothetical protein